jgi:hypothetical protein
MRGTEPGGQASETLAHGDRLVALRQLLVAVVLCAAVAGGDVSLFQRGEVAEYLAGFFGAVVVVVLSVRAAAAGGRSARGALDRVGVLHTFLRLSWVPCVVMLLVGIHAVTASYDAAADPRDAPLHVLGWLVLAVTALLGSALFALHRREPRPTAWKLMPVLLFVLAMAGSVASAAHEKEIRQTVQPCACEMP